MKSPTLTSIIILLAQTATVHYPVITSLRSFTELYCDEQHWSTGYTLSRSQATGTCIGLYESRSLSVGFLDARCHGRRDRYGKRIGLVKNRDAKIREW
ncbi:hypothetical protein NEUTE1DRAFT_48574 [Neurospora tetrasperma FGSC 2508]|uniref:Cyanovirin-N domain-containing protein n=1 Tax=Neurospora tetrasperma (strain FGSC 2508 / ATCC MYA-4615 / P0657) TaxID=510951 RepID=F8MXI6_NEUT8|nr:uncharacterized protein NEUTE1DRAFT_48574 [Neurospora tetrasperma FGSC 2508]EGO54457.1 hypothetical protein NEUTE1DRAFT_48574 [Neurospora tetrasperma FGSC 2508]EGZ68092.1 hypothetical protein NEUTE2DRAFT_74046 [Neurospora tetrasperma FGSC 2509]